MTVDDGSWRSLTLWYGPAVVVWGPHYDCDKMVIAESLLFVATVEDDQQRACLRALSLSSTIRLPSCVLGILMKHGPRCVGQPPGVTGYRIELGIL